MPSLLELMDAHDRPRGQRDGAHGPAGDHRGAAARRLRHPRPGRRPGRGRRAVHGGRRHRGRARAEDAAESELLLQARRLSLTALETVSTATMIDDVCVPRSRLGEMLEGVARDRGRSTA